MILLFLKRLNDTFEQNAENLIKKVKATKKHIQTKGNLFVDHYRREVISTLQSRHATKEAMNHNTQ